MVFLSFQIVLANVKILEIVECDELVVMVKFGWFCAEWFLWCTLLFDYNMYLVLFSRYATMKGVTWGTSHSSFPDKWSSILIHEIRKQQQLNPKSTINARKKLGDRTVLMILSMNHSIDKIFIRNKYFDFVIKQTSRCIMHMALTAVIQTSATEVFLWYLYNFINW